MPAAKRSGFILIYVAAMLAVIGVLLLQLGRMQSPSPLFIERQIAHVLQRGEQQMLLEFVVAGLRKQTLAMDPRYLQFRQMLASAPRPPSDLDEQIAWLKAALAQLGIKVDERGAGAATGSVASGATPGARAPEGQEVLFRPRKTPYAFKLGAIEYEITVLPGNGFPNLNSIPFEALVRALARLEVPEREVKELAAALIDWRDADEFRTEGIGAESDYYLGRSPPYAPRNAPFQSWQELNYVRGMTPERVRLLRESFVLGPAVMTGLSIEFGSAEAFADLTGIAQERVRELLRAYGRLTDTAAPVGDILLTPDAAKFEKALAFDLDPSVLRIRIRSPDSTITADYDFRNKQLMAVW